MPPFCYTLNRMRRPVILSGIALVLACTFFAATRSSLFADVLGTLTADTASGSALTGSGAEEHIHPQEDNLLNERIERSKNFAIQRSKTKNEMEALQKASRQQWARRLALSEECRMDIRKANKDSLDQTIRRCFRSDITLRMNLWKKDLLYTDAMPGIGKMIRQNALEKTDALIRAGQAILDGIDTGVFTSSADMEEANRNLRTKFLDPKRLADAQVEVEHLRSWIAHLVVNAAKISPETGTGTVMDVRNEAVSCLTQTDEALADTASATDLPALLEDLRLNRRTLMMCVENFFSEANPPEDAEETEDAEEDKEDANPLLLPRRIQRRIGTPRT